MTVDDLPNKVQEFHVTRIVIPAGPTGSPDAMITMEEMERRYVRQVLEAVRGNKTHAARILGIDRRSLYRRLEEPRHDAKPSDAGSHGHPRATTVPPPMAHSSNGHGQAAGSSGHPGDAE